MTREDDTVPRALGYRRSGSGDRQRQRDTPRPSPGVARVGVIGGGTAGYLTALALRRRYPSLAVTIVESSRIPVIGVGEATNPDLVGFLHRTLGVDELQRSRGTADMEARHSLPVGDRGHRRLSPPLHGRANLRRRRPCARSGTCIGAQLIGAGPRAHAPRPGRRLHRRSRPRHTRTTSTTRGSSRSSSDSPSAGHRARRQRHRRGGRRAGRSGSAPAANDGGTLDFDLYVDATGFRSLLIDKDMDAAGVPFQPDVSSLPTDAAAFADVPRGGIDPFIRSP